MRESAGADRCEAIKGKTGEAAGKDGCQLTEEDLEILTAVPPMRTIDEWVWYMRRVKPIFNSGRMPADRLESMNLFLISFLASFAGQLSLLEDLDGEEEEW